MQVVDAPAASVVVCEHDGAEASANESVTVIPVTVVELVLVTV